MVDLHGIYERFDDQLRRFVHGRVADPAAADDIVQDVYLRIHAKIGGLREGDRLESWIYQIARNAIVDHYRPKRPVEELPEQVARLADDGEETDEVLATLAASVETMLSCLPDHYREALEFTELRGMSQVEMAKALGLSVSGAKSRVQRARERLKQAFLECCHFELDRHGRVIDYYPRCADCASDGGARKIDGSPRVGRSAQIALGDAGSVRTDEDAVGTRAAGGVTCDCECCRGTSRPSGAGTGEHALPVQPSGRA